MSDVVHDRERIFSEHFIEGLDVGHATATNKDRDVLQESLLLLAEQVVAPLDGFADGLLATWEGFGGAGEEVEATFETGKQELGRHNLDTSCGEFDGEGETIEASANLSDGSGVLVREL